MVDENEVPHMDDSLSRELDKVTDAVLASYDTDPRTRRIDDAFLPSHGRIVKLVDLLRRLLFPGYFTSKVLTKHNVRFHVGILLEEIQTVLADQVAHCICSDDHPSCEVCSAAGPCHHRAQRVAQQFLGQIPSIRDALALDAQAAYDGDPAAKNIAEVIYCYPGFYAVTVYRIAHELWDLGVPLMARIMSEHAHSVTGCDIHPAARIGKSFFIDHATGVVIGETSRIGDNVKIYQGVTLGAKSFPKDERGRVIKGLQRHPTIEDRVTIYANATILGGQTVVGRGATVAGNTFITESVTADSVAEVTPPEVKVRAKKTRRVES